MFNEFWDDDAINYANLLYNITLHKGIETKNSERNLP